MNEFGTVAEALDKIRGRNGRYDERAYLFVLAALEYFQTKLPERRHIRGQELALACRDLALQQYGLMARTVLEHWGVRATADFGRMVFTLIEVGLLAKQPSDRIEDFDRVYDFAEAFDAGYRWPGEPPA